MSKRFAPAVAALAVGVLAGAATSLLAFLLARYGPAADGWSFRGNGALAAYLVLPALLAGGWTAFVLRARGHRSWLGLGLLAGLVGLAIAAIDSALLPVFGPGADAAVGGFLLIAVALWVLVAPAIATRFPPSGTAKAGTAGTQVLAGVAWLAGIAAGLIVLGIILPAGS